MAIEKESEEYYKLKRVPIFEMKATMRNFDEIKDTLISMGYRIVISAFYPYLQINLTEKQVTGSRNRTTPVKCITFDNLVELECQYVNEINEKRAYRYFERRCMASIREARIRANETLFRREYEVEFINIDFNVRR